MHTRFRAFSEKFFEKFISSPIPTGRGQMQPLNGKIFPNEKTSSLIWTKGAEMHTNFGAFSKKFFEKIYPFTCSHWRSAFGDSSLEKRQKNLPARYGGQGILAFFSLNIGEKTFNST